MRGVFHVAARHGMTWPLDTAITWGRCSVNDPRRAGWAILTAVNGCRAANRAGSGQRLSVWPAGLSCRVPASATTHPRSSWARHRASPAGGSDCFAVARSPALHLDPATGRWRFRHPLVAGQDPVHPALRSGSAHSAGSCPGGQGTAGALAAPVRGASFAGRSRFQPARRIHSLQPSKKRIRDTADGLGAFELSAVCRGGCLFGGLGVWRDVVRRHWA